MVEGVYYVREGLGGGTGRGGSGEGRIAAAEWVEPDEGRRLAAVMIDKQREAWAWV